jgi:hypothetical protein
LKNCASPTEARTSPDRGELDRGVRLTFYLGVAIIAILAAFFFVGPVVGIIVLLAAVVLGILGVVAVIRRAEESD